MFFSLASLPVLLLLFLNQTLLILPLPLVFLYFQEKRLCCFASSSCILVSTSFPFIITFLILARDVCILAILDSNASTLLVKLLTGATKAPPSACTLFSSIAPLPANTKAPPPKPFYWF